MYRWVVLFHDGAARKGNIGVKFWPPYRRLMIASNIRRTWVTRFPFFRYNLLTPLNSNPTVCHINAGSTPVPITRLAPSGKTQDMSLHDQGILPADDEQQSRSDKNLEEYKEFHDTTTTVAVEATEPHIAKNFRFVLWLWQRMVNV